MKIFRVKQSLLYRSRDMMLHGFAPMLRVVMTNMCSIAHGCKIGLSIMQDSQ